MKIYNILKNILLVFLFVSCEQIEMKPEHAAFDDLNENIILLPPRVISSSSVELTFVVRHALYKSSAGQISEQDKFTLNILAESAAYYENYTLQYAYTYNKLKASNFTIKQIVTGLTPGESYAAVLEVVNSEIHSNIVEFVAGDGKSTKPDDEKPIIENPEGEDPENSPGEFVITANNIGNLYFNDSDNRNIKVRKVGSNYIMVIASRYGSFEDAYYTVLLFENSLGSNPTVVDNYVPLASAAFDIAEDSNGQLAIFFSDGYDFKLKKVNINPDFTIDFDSEITVTQVSTAYDNDLLLSQDENGDWYAFNGVNRYGLGSDFSHISVSTAKLESPNTQLVKADNNFYGFSFAYSNRAYVINQFNFGSKISNTPTSLAIEISEFEIGRWVYTNTSWYLIGFDLSSDLTIYSFGNNPSTNNPTSLEIGDIGIRSSYRSGMALAKEDNLYYAFVTDANGLYRINLGSKLEP